MIDGDEGVVTVNLHIHVPPGVRHQDADRPQSDNAQFFALDLAACETGFFFLD